MLLVPLAFNTPARAVGELVQIRLDVTDAVGTPLTEVAVGDAFEIRAFVRDVRPSGEAQGVFAAYLDVTWDGSKATVAGPITYGASYGNATAGDTSTAGTIDEVGTIAGFTPVGSGELLLFRVPMTAAAVGEIVFSGGPADEVPAHDVALFGRNEIVPPELVVYGSAPLSITASGGSTTTTTTSLPTGSSTTTTLDQACSAGATFASVLCRVTELRTATSNSVGLGRLQGKLALAAQSAGSLVMRANAACAATGTRNASKKAAAQLRKATKKLAAYARTLRSRRIKPQPPEEVRAALLARVDPLAADVTALRTRLQCPADGST